MLSKKRNSSACLFTRACFLGNSGTRVEFLVLLHHDQAAPKILRSNINVLSSLIRLLVRFLVVVGFIHVKIQGIKKMWWYPCRLVGLRLTSFEEDFTWGERERECPVILDPRAFTFRRTRERPVIFVLGCSGLYCKRLPRTKFLSMASRPSKRSSSVLLSPSHAPVTITEVSNPTVVATVVQTTNNSAPPLQRRGNVNCQKSPWQFRAGGNSNSSHWILARLIAGLLHP